jgi:hypothetical protein
MVLEKPRYLKGAPQGTRVVLAGVKPADVSPGDSTLGAVTSYYTVIETGVLVICRPPDGGFLISPVASSRG